MLPDSMKFMRMCAKEKDQIWTFDLETQTQGEEQRRARKSHGPGHGLEEPL